MVTGSARAVSKSKPKPFLASLADIIFIENPNDSFELFCLLCALQARVVALLTPNECGVPLE
jgi:hypothetical protein